jgi:hypothetical protein
MYWSWSLLFVVLVLLRMIASHRGRVAVAGFHLDGMELLPSTQLWGIQVFLAGYCDASYLAALADGRSGGIAICSNICQQVIAVLQ